MARFHSIKVVGGASQIVPYTAQEEADADAAEIVDAAAKLDRIADKVLENRGAIKALALTILSEINILRGEAGLVPRTVAQLKNAVRSNSG